MIKIVFFVPPSHLDLMKETLFQVGAGQSNGYRHCSWQTLGTMNFIPEGGSNPTEGEKGQSTTETLYRVEMVCKEQYIKQAVEALHRVHPYEVPPFELYKLETDPTEVT